MCSMFCSSGENNKLGGEHSNKCILQDERIIFAHKDKLLYRAKALTRARAVSTVTYLPKYFLKLHYFYIV